MLPAVFVLLDIRLFKVEVRDRFAEKRYLVIFDLTAIFQFLGIWATKYTVIPISFVHN